MKTSGKYFTEPFSFATIDSVTKVAKSVKNSNESTMA